MLTMIFALALAGQFSLDGASAAAFSPDGKVIAVAGPGDAATLHDAVTGKELSRVKGHDAGWVADLAFSSDGVLHVASYWFASVEEATADRLAGRETPPPFVEVYAWDLAARKPLWKHRRDGGIGVPRLAVSPDGQLVAASWGARNESVRLWDAPTGILLHTFPGPKSYTVQVLAFSPDGATLAAGASDCTRLLNIAERKERGSVPGNIHSRGQLAWSGDGKTLATVHGLLRLIDMDSLKVRHAHGTQAVATVPKKQALAVGGGGGRVLFVDPATGKELASARTRDGARFIAQIAFCPNGKRMAVTVLEETGWSVKVLDTPRLP